ncbi:hypothetical protein C0995_000208 [Termitomyces sp. Mi166|nr:hypothetical protein C0995_000208 [Termitomyces sp. Mi166\
MSVVPLQPPGIVVQEPDDNNESTSSGNQDFSTGFLRAQTRSLRHGLGLEESDRSMDWEDYVVSSATDCLTPVELSSILETDNQVSFICARLIEIFRDFGKYTKFLRYRDEAAKDLLDLLQKLLDHDLLESQFRIILCVALVRLCRKSELCPRCFSLQDVRVDSKNVPLTTGAFGDIYRDRAALEKVILYFSSSDLTLMIKRQAYSREAVVWGQLLHPNILPFYGIYRLDDHNKLCLVSPWMYNGNIFDVVSGIKYLHENGVVHGDLKSVNILVTEFERACLADFGFSYVTELGGLGGDTLSSRHADGGTRGFEAPELAESDDLRKTNASDVFAFGMVCFEIFTGELPFGRHRAAAIDYKILSGERPKRPNSQLHVQRGLTDTIWALMEKCWSHSPEIRPTAAQILQELPFVETNSQTANWEWTRSRRLSFETSGGQVDATITSALSHLQPLL